MAKVVITDYEYPDIEAEKRIISGAGHELLGYHAENEAELMSVTRDADAVIVQCAGITRKIVENLAHCRMIIKYGVGINNIDAAAATERGIWVCNVPDYGLDEVSAHASALILSLARKLPAADRAMKQGGFGNSHFRPLSRFAGSTLGIVGFGAIGSLVARKMGGFSLRILAYDPFFDQEKAKALGVEAASFETLCRESDFITVHCPLYDRTEHMFNRAVFQSMKKTAYFVNTSRGGVVREEDLIAALESGEIAGAGIDVYETEPPKAGNRLLSLPNVICTGHVAWYSEEAIVALQRKAAEEVVNVLAGNKPFHPCNQVAS